MKIIQYKITSEFAKTLRSNLHQKLYKNHSPDFEKIMQFAEMIKKGEWKINNDDSPISISENGQLMNGYHRLCAVSITGVPIYDKVAFDVPEGLILENEKSKIENKDLFVWCCAELVLDYLNIQTRSLSTVEKIYFNIFDSVKKYSDCKEKDRKEAAIVLAFLCFEKSNKEKFNQMIKRKNLINVEPTKLVYFSYLHLLNQDDGNYEMSVKMPMEKLLPSSIYEAK